MYSTDIKFVRKRDGRLEPFDPPKIEKVIFAAAKAVGGENVEKAREITRQTISFLEVLYKGDRVPSVENIQDLVEKVLIEKKVVLPSNSCVKKVGIAADRFSIL